MAEPTRQGSLPGDPFLLRMAAMGFAVVAAALLFAMMIVTTIDVAGRYIFAQPLPGASEISQILLGLIIYFALPAVCLNQEHIVVGLVFDRLQGRARRIAGAIINAMGAVLLLVAARELWNHGSRLASYNDVTIYLRVPTGPLAQIMAVLALASALILLVNAWLIATDRKRAGGAEMPSID